MLINHAKIPKEHLRTTLSEPDDSSTRSQTKHFNDGKRTSRNEYKEAITATISMEEKTKADKVFIDTAVRKNFLFANLSTKLKKEIIQGM